MEELLTISRTEAFLAESLLRNVVDTLDSEQDFVINICESVRSVHALFAKILLGDQDDTTPVDHHQEDDTDDDDRVD
jgi:hypothetical protein